MKKNIALRTASVAMVAALISTSMISGTFAKYTTGDSASDVARVAKWGVELQSAGNLYEDAYATSTNIATNSVEDATVSVKTSQGTAMSGVAPGTKNATGLSFSLNGKPEVDSKLSATIQQANVFLKAGTYGVMVKCDKVNADNFDELKADLYLYDSTGKTYTNCKYATAITADAVYYTLEDAVTTAEDYYPVAYDLAGTTADANISTLASTNLGNDGSNALAENTLNTISATLAKQLNNGTAVTGTTGTAGSVTDGTDTYVTYSVSGQAYEQNTDLATTLKLDGETLTWEWAFDRAETTKSGNAACTADKADTILGDLIAESQTASDFKGDVVYLSTADNGTNGAVYTAVTVTSAEHSITDIDGQAVTSDDPKFTVYYATDSSKHTVACLTTYFYMDINVSQVD